MMIIDPSVVTVLSFNVPPNAAELAHARKELKKGRYAGQKDQKKRSRKNASLIIALSIVHRTALISVMGTLVVMGSQLVRR